MNRSLQDAFSNARRMRPAPLPANFPDEVMALLHRTPRREAPLWRDLAVQAAMGVLVAGAIGWIGGFRKETREDLPPPLTMFQGSPLFAIR